VTITTVLVGYTTLTATLALAISLLNLRLLPVRGSSPAAGGAVSLPASGPEVASPAPPILAATSTGELLDTSTSSGRSYLVAFLSSSCLGCRAALPALLGHGRLPGSPRLIAVLVGDRRRGADLEQQLASLATIVFEQADGPIATAYRITGFPSYVLVSAEGTVLATGRSVLELPQPQPQ
jgi:hypothetical protein